MKKITNDAILAFNNHYRYKSSNTAVTLLQNGDTILSLFGNDIARRDGVTGEVTISNAGWFSKTTKERLNGLYGVSISQKAGEWYLNGIKWGGHWINPLTMLHASE